MEQVVVAGETRVPPMEIIVRHVTLTVRDTSTWLAPKPQVRLLNDINVSFRTGELTALMGSSGCGKSTLMNVLAGCAQGECTGSVLVNGLRLSPSFYRLVGYMPQHMEMFEVLTVREQVQFCADLLMPRGTPSTERKARVDALLEQLNIRQCAESRLATISGGERKRVALASVLVTNPAVVLLDEPLSGLDSGTAWSTMQLLRQLARERLVIASIHQPSNEILQLIDRVLLLAKPENGTGGNVGFFGKPRELADFFERAGFALRREENMGYQLMKVVTPVARMGEDGVMVTVNQADIVKVCEVFARDYREELVQSLAQRSQHSLAALGMGFRHPTLRNSAVPSSGVQEDFYCDPVPRVPWWRMFYFIFIRGARVLLRNHIYFRVNSATVLFESLFCGVIYFQMSSTQTGLLERAGGLYLFVAMLYMTCMFTQLEIFPSQMPVVQRELHALFYPWTYWVSTSTLSALMDTWTCLIYMFFYVFAGLDSTRFGLFFLTCWLLQYCGTSVALIFSVATDSAAAAFATAPLLYIPHLAYGGLLILVGSIPVWLAWVKWLDPWFYSFVILMKNELTGHPFNCTPSELILSVNNTLLCPFPLGELYVNYIGLGDVDILFSLCMLGVLIFGYRALSLSIFLWRTRQRPFLRGT
jgi:ABC-type multidrug transport system ATPase subunit